jgi:hypothetical protein
VLEVDEGLCRPEFIPQFLTRDQFPRSLQQHLQDGQWLAFQAHPHPSLRSSLVTTLNSYTPKPMTFDLAGVTMLVWTPENGSISVVSLRLKRLSLYYGTNYFSMTSTITYKSPNWH